jgi:hypothetical protein
MGQTESSEPLDKGALQRDAWTQQVTAFEAAFEAAQLIKPPALRGVSNQPRPTRRRLVMVTNF